MDYMMYHFIREVNRYPFGVKVTCIENGSHYMVKFAMLTKEVLHKLSDIMEDDYTINLTKENYMKRIVIIANTLRGSTQIFMEEGVV